MSKANGWLVLVLTAEVTAARGNTLISAFWAYIGVQPRILSLAAQVSENASQTPSETIRRKMTQYEYSRRENSCI